MADVNPTETGLTVKITDGTASEMVAVVTTTPSGSEAALATRETERGQNTSAGSIPVVMASDQSSLDVTLTAEYAEDSVHTSGNSGLFILTVRNDSFASTLTSANGDYSPISVDSAGRIFTAATKLEDAAHASGDAGTFVLAVRNDTFATTLTSTNGDYSPIAVDSAGKVFGASDRAEDAAHASGHIGSFVLGVRNDASAARTSADGDYSPISVDSVGRVYVADGGGSISVDDNSGSLTVDFLGQYAEDSIHTSGDTGVFVLAVRNDSQTALAGNGDYVPLTVDSTGSLWVRGRVTNDSGYAEDSVHTSGDRGLFMLAVRNDTGATTFTSANGDYSPIAVDSAGRPLVAQPTASVLNAQVVGNVAHDAVDSGNPIKIGGIARSSLPAGVANGDRVSATFDKIGRQAITMQPREGVVTGFIALTSTTETTILAAAGAGVYLDLVTIDIVYNTTTTGDDGIAMVFRDATGGPLRFGSIAMPIAQNGRGPVQHVFPATWPQTTANNNWTVQLLATPTAGTAVGIMVTAITNV